MRTKKYNRRTWLNSQESPSTGNVVAFDGEIETRKGEKMRNTFLSISDCYNTIRLHPTKDESINVFVTKIRLLSNEIMLFAEHLEKSIKNENEENT